MHKNYIKNSSGELIDVTEKDYQEQKRLLEEMRESGIQCNIQVIVEADGYMSLSEAYELTDETNRQIKNNLLNKHSKHVL